MLRGRTQFVMFKDLSREHQKSKIRFRVDRMWEAFNTQKNKEFMSIDFLAINEQETVIHFVIRSKIAEDYRGSIEEGKYYVLKNFCVFDSKAKYKMSNHRFFVQFHAGTVIEEMIENLPTIARHKFDFLPFELLDKRADEGGHLTDIVGRLCALSDKMERQSDGHSIQM